MASGHREGGGVVVVGYGHPALIGEEVINPEGDGLAHLGLGKVMHADLGGRPAAIRRPHGVVTHEFLLLQPTKMTGSPAATWALDWSLMWWKGRRGRRAGRPRSAWTCPGVSTPCIAGAGRPGTSWPDCPWVSSAARRGVLLSVHRSGDVGPPWDSGSTSESRAANSSRSMSVAFLRPYRPTDTLGRPAPPQSSLVPADEGFGWRARATSSSTSQNPPTALEWERRWRPVWLALRLHEKSAVHSMPE